MARGSAWGAASTPSEKQAPQSFLRRAVPKELRGLQRAQHLGRCAASVGFDWPSLEGPWAKIEEELGELRGALASGLSSEIADELGDVLFAVVNLARHLEVDAETALEGTNERFTARFDHIEASLAKEGRMLEETSLEELEARWVAAKAALGAPQR